MALGQGGSPEACLLGDKARLTSIHGHTCSLLPCAQASLSDDDLEYPASATTSGGGAEAVSISRNLRAKGKGKPAASESESESEEDDGDGFDDAAPVQSFEKPSSLAVRAANFAALGKALEAGCKEEEVKFDTAVVGAGGAGFEWQSNEGFDIERYTIAVPNL